MTRENNFHAYFLSYNLCSNALLTGFGCSDYRTYLRTKIPTDESIVRERFGKPGFEFTLYSLEEMTKEEIEKLGFSPDLIPVFEDSC